jgi:hypothetical protein
MGLKETFELVFSLYERMGPAGMVQQPLKSTLQFWGLCPLHPPAAGPSPLLKRKFIDIYYKLEKVCKSK